MELNINLNFTECQNKLNKVCDILKSQTKTFIVIDGIIGAGKSTLINLIEKHINNTNDITNDITNNITNDITNNVNNITINKNEPNKKSIKAKAIYEPVDLWNKTGALQYFYENIEKNCYEFQTYTYITRINSVLDEIYNNQDADMYILERSIWTDKHIFMELLREMVGPLRMTMYNQWCEMWSYILPLRVDKWVFLDISLDESLKRITHRARTAEHGISIKYQTDLYNKHIEFYDNLSKTGQPVVIIKNDLINADFINDKTILNNIIKQILNT